ncbi:hypothetical protein L3i23_04910 [Herbiconiux sp. L3-i23]|nr:hypothetical protein L3i23_04910 [Herbiconiux sp. L3-i23]
MLGADLAGLHPRLRAYFSAIPPGHVGLGEGVWDAVGTPRRWLWPVLSVLGAEGIAFPAWGSGVTFTVENVPGGSAVHPSVAATRAFRFPRGDRAMVDSIAVRGGELVDRLGRSRRIVARLDPRIEDGALRMSSTAVRVRIGRRTVAVPDLLAPRVDLTERFDDAVGRQHVSLTLTVPLIGRVYEYSGHFEYRVVPRADAMIDR